MNLLAYAIPYYWTLIAIEWVIARREKRDIFRFNDTVADVNMGILERATDIFIKAAVLAAYIFIFDRFHLATVSTRSLFMWIVCFIIVDFCFYWAHRACHRVNFLWACHIVHHSSEEMNLTVALRQSATETMFTWLFYLPLAVLGFPPIMWFACFQVNLLWQFGLHTRLVKRLGPFERVMNTPSHHRVHHGADEKYIDKNYAGTFIIWDRLFGTYTTEEEEPIYGIVSPLKSWNPLWGHLHYWVRLGRMAWHAPRMRDKFRVWFREPAYVPEGLDWPASKETVRDEGYKKFDPPVPRLMNRYILVHFIVAMILLSAFLIAEPGMPWSNKTMATFFIVITLVSMGGIFELRRWAFFLETARLIFLPALLILWGDSLFGLPGMHQGWVVAPLILVSASGLYWFLRYRRDFQLHAFHLPEYAQPHGPLPETVPVDHPRD